MERVLRIGSKQKRHNRALLTPIKVPFRDTCFHTKTSIRDDGEENLYSKDQEGRLPIIRHRLKKIVKIEKHAINVSPIFSKRGVERALYFICLVFAWSLLDHSNWSLCTNIMYEH